jgi:hypothetical protein
MKTITDYMFSYCDGQHIPFRGRKKKITLYDEMSGTLQDGRRVFLYRKKWTWIINLKQCSAMDLRSGLCAICYDHAAIDLNDICTDCTHKYSLAEIKA